MKKKQKHLWGTQQTINLKFICCKRVFLTFFLFSVVGSSKLYVMNLNFQVFLEIINGLAVMSNAALVCFIMQNVWPTSTHLSTRLWAFFIFQVFLYCASLVVRVSPEKKKCYSFIQQVHCKHLK